MWEFTLLSQSCYKVFLLEISIERIYGELFLHGTVVRTSLFCLLFPPAVGDGRQGYPEEAPYDAIHVGAAAPTVPKEVRVVVRGVSCCWLPSSVAVIKL